MYIPEFIKEHTDWEQILTEPPYCLTIKRDDGYILFEYNQFDSDFNIPLVREARGIIFREADMKCVCHPFDKFGNYGEEYVPTIDWENCTVQQKVDGSLIKLWYDDVWHISTNGNINAFNSHISNLRYPSFGALVLAAIIETARLDEHEFFAALNKDYTYFFELVSPFNRVVIPYPTIRLFFLGLRNMITDEEMMPETVCEDPMLERFRIPNRYPLGNLEEVQLAASRLPWNEEGYVVCDKNFHRAKIKSPAYVKAHYARNNNIITTEDLLQVVLNNEKDEFLLYADDYKDQLEEIEGIVNKIIADIRYAWREVYNATEYCNKKDLKNVVQKYPAHAQDFIYCLNDDKLIRDYIKGWPIRTWLKAIDKIRKGEQ